MKKCIAPLVLFLVIFSACEKETFNPNAIEMNNEKSKDSRDNINVRGEPDVITHMVNYFKNKKLKKKYGSPIWNVFNAYEDGYGGQVGFVPTLEEDSDQVDGILLGFVRNDGKFFITAYTRKQILKLKQKDKEKINRID